MGTLKEMGWSKQQKELADITEDEIRFTYFIDHHLLI
jgi:hypothetical protein